MGQIVFNGQKPKYCNLISITTGNHAADVPKAGEVWLIDSTNSSKPDGTGKYDYYIVGDNSKTASQLALEKIRIDDNDIITIDDTPTENSDHAVSSGGVYQAIQAIDVSSQISGKADKSEMSVVPGTGANADKTTITLKSGTSATVLTQHQDVSEFLKEGEVFGTGDDTTASFNPYSDTVWNKAQTLSEIQKQQIRENIGAGAADNEDIQNVSGTLKFADKAYNTSAHSGLGRKYLRKNVVDNKNVLTQAMVNTANTIYHIQYDYDLNGQTITLPAGCVLEFDGGSITNGTLVFNDTAIKGLQDNSITGCRFNGTISNEEINVKHLGVSSSLADAAPVINDIIGLLTSEKRKKMYFPAGVYTTMDSIIPCDNLEIYGDGENTRIQNLAEVGEPKIVIHCENYPSLSTGAARAADYTKYAITSISDDRMSIEVSGTFELSVGDISAIFVGLMAENRYYNFTYVGIVTAINGNKITFDQPIKEIPSSRTLSDAFFAPKASGSASNRFCRKNVYVHDIYLYQKTGVQSGYYCLTGGYNCRYERLKMHASTPMGSNITAHCVYKDIIADCEAGFWDAAELTYDNVFENIQIFRYDSRLNNIGFSVTNGSHNKVKNLELHGNNATVGGYYASFLSIDGLKIFDCTYYTSSSVMGILPCASDEKIKNVHFINCSVLKSSSGNHFFIVHTTRGDAENVFGNFVVGDGVSPANRFECLYTDNINVSSNLHLGSLVGASFNKYRGMSKMESAQIAFGTRFAEASLGTLITNGTVFVHSKFDIIYPDSSIATTGRNVRLYVYNKQAYINFGYTFTNFNWLNADLYITINNEKADYVLVTSNPEFHEVKTGTLDITDRSGSTLSLMMRTNANTADTFYNNYCYTEIYY